MNESHAVAPSSTRPYWITIAALFVLLVATVGVAEFEFGRWNFPLAVAIATVKAILILLIFMHLWDSKPLLWLFAASGFLMLAILILITLSDYLTRPS